MTKRNVFKVGDRVRIVNYGGLRGNNLAGEGVIKAKSGALFIVDLDAPNELFVKHFTGIPCESTELESV